MEKSMTFPVIPTVCGLLPAESVKVSVAVRAPVAAGVKAMVTVQLADASRVAPHVLLVIAKSAEFGPDMAMLLMLIVL